MIHIFLKSTKIDQSISYYWIILILILLDIQFLNLVSFWSMLFLNSNLYSLNVEFESWEISKIKGKAISGNARAMTLWA